MHPRRAAFALLVCLIVAPLARAQALPGTQLLATKQDLAKEMVEGIDRYLTRQLQAAPAKRAEAWKQLDHSSAAAHEKSIQPKRERLRQILGAADQRVPVTMEYVASTEHPALLAETTRYKVYAVRWPALPNVHGEGLLLEPTGKARGCV